jgi:hypothetical protein
MSDATPRIAMEMDRSMESRHRQGARMEWKLGSKNSDRSNIAVYEPMGEA